MPIGGNGRNSLLQFLCCKIDALPLDSLFIALHSSFGETP